MIKLKIVELDSKEKLKIDELECRVTVVTEEKDKLERNNESLHLEF